MFQILAADALASRVRGEAGAAMDTSFVDLPATRWAALAIIASNGRTHARAGQVEAARADLERVIVGIERAPGWAINYPMMVCDAAEVLWWIVRTDHLDVIEANLRA